MDKQSSEGRNPYMNFLKATSSKHVGSQGSFSMRSYSNKYENNEFMEMMVMPNERKGL